jgi:DNA-binding response OmpR family regulator
MPSARNHHRMSVILIVDNDIASSDVLKELMTLAGYQQVFVCTESTEALTTINTLKPDILILDHHMPYMTGNDILRELNLSGKLSEKMPVIMLTGVAEFKIKKEALHWGISDFINKPYIFEELNLRIQNLLQKSWLYKQLEENNQLLEQRVAERTVTVSSLNSSLEEQITVLKEISWVQSHVIRAPLARLMAIINLMKDYGTNDPTELNHFLQLSIDSANELDQIFREIAQKSHIAQNIKKEI